MAAVETVSLFWCRILLKQFNFCFFSKAKLAILRTFLPVRGVPAFQELITNGLETLVSGMSHSLSLVVCEEIAFFSGREASARYNACCWISVLVFFSFRWWQFRRRPSHHPFGKAWICIQLWASTDVSTDPQSSTQGPAAHPPDQNSCCGWRGNLFNGSF